MQRILPRNGFVLPVTCILLLLVMAGCHTSSPFRIGFVTQLSGRNATLGVEGRNGALLAVEVINQQGGAAGRTFELVVRDDAGSKEQLLAANQELLSAGVDVLSGHMISWEAIAVQTFIAEQDILLLSPTATSPELTGIKDNFFRLLPVNSKQAIPLAEYVYQKKGLRSAVLLYDADNQAFAKTFGRAFIDRFTALGGTSFADAQFSSSTTADLRPIIQEIYAIQPEVLVVAASSVDTAIIAQQARLLGWNVQIVAPQWAYTNDLVSYGGSAVEGILIASHYNDACQSPEYLDFKQKYEDKYGQAPGFAAIISYESIQVLAKVLELNGGKTEELQSTLSQLRDFNGLCDQISIDENGDAYRSTFIVTISDGKFSLVDKQAPMIE